MPDEPIQTGMQFERSGKLYEKFRVGDFGIDPAAFITELAAPFEKLEWDMFDVRKKQLALLTRIDPDLSEKMQNRSRQFYRGEIEVGEFLRVSADEAVQKTQQEILDIKPHRKRAMSVFQVGLQSNEPVIERAAHKPYIQPDIAGYERSEPRQYPRCPDEMTDNPAIISLVREFSRKLKNVHPNATGVEVQLHPTRVVARPNEVSRPTLESIHNDGADYIISALVVARENVVGAESIVYDSDASTVLLREILQPGEGIFQDDARLFHEATPIRTANPSKEGHRDMIGFDFHLQYGS